MSGWNWVEPWQRDFRHGLRLIARRPALSATLILTLTLGIGASSAVFSLIDTVLLRPLPYPDSQRLVAVYESRVDANNARSRIAPARLEDWNRLSHSFQGIAGSYFESFTDTTGPVPERISGAVVSPRFFAVLGTAPIAGRVFNREEEQSGGPASVVISHGLWQRRYSGNPGVVGTRLRFTDTSYTVVGVMPPSFRYPSAATEVWVPKQASAALMRVRQARFYNGIGRLKPGAMPQQAQADLATLQGRLGQQYPRTDAGWGASVRPLRDEWVGGISGALWLLFCAVGLLLLIACANVGCLLLAKANYRAAEMATRFAVGANRYAVVRQLLAEGLIYALAGAGLGLIAAFAGVRLFRRMLPDMPRILEMQLDLRIVAFASIAAVLSTVLFSLAPVLQTVRRDAATVLAQGGRSVLGGRQRLPRALVSAQLALATVLLIAAGLLLRSLLRLQDAPLGFTPENVLTLRISASFSESADAVVQRQMRTLNALSTIPGVRAASMSTELPGADPAPPQEVHIPGETAAGNEEKAFAGVRVTSAGYFQTVGIPLLAGQTCRMDSDPQRPFAALINQKFVERYFPGRNPIGHTLIQGPRETGRSTEIVGIVGNSREEGFAKEPEPIIYTCGFLRFWPDAYYLVRTHGAPAGFADAIRDAIRTVEPSRAVYEIRPLSDVLSATLASRRFQALLVGLFSALALGLAAVGLYGVTSYMVSQQTREIGIRMALGARRGRIVFEVLRAGGALAIIGMAVGFGVAAIFSKVAASLFYGVSPTDLSTYAMVAVTLMTVAFLACLIPSYRALSVNPLRALREQ